jgi:PKD repeat protein
MNLWEGNIVDDRLSFDYTHGSGSHNTIFRSYLTHGPAWKTGGRWAVDLQESQWCVNVVGNVLGCSGMGGTLYVNGDGQGEGIYRFGYDTDGGAFSDSNVQATVFLNGNFDYLTNGANWDSSVSSHNLPQSEYLAAKPAWFGNTPWPPIGPDISNGDADGAGHAFKIPAQQCFEAQNLDNGGIFDPVFYSAPVNLTALAVSSSGINLSWSAPAENFGVTGYNIFRDGVQIATVTGTTYSDSGLSPSTTYTYTVSSYNSVGNNSAVSAPASAATNAQNGQSPVINSGPTATPNPAQINQSVSFSVSATDPQGLALTYAWTFGNGAGTGTGLNASYAYSAAGTYTATVTVKDVNGLTATGTITVTIVTTGPGATGGDGGGPQILTVNKLEGSVKFNVTGRDACTLTGSIPNVAPGFNPSGVVVLLNVGGAQAVFTLNAKGKVKSSNGSLMLKLKPSTLNKPAKKIEFQGGPVRFTAKLTHGSWADDWAADGVVQTGAAKGAVLTMPVSLSLGGTLYSTPVSITYSGKAGSGGKFKN